MLDVYTGCKLQQLINKPKIKKTTPINQCNQTKIGEII